MGRGIEIFPHPGDHRDGDRISRDGMGYGIEKIRGMIPFTTLSLIVPSEHEFSRGHSMRSGDITVVTVSI